MGVRERTNSPVGKLAIRRGGLVVHASALRVAPTPSAFRRRRWFDHSAHGQTMSAEKEEHAMSALAKVCERLGTESEHGRGEEYTWTAGEKAVIIVKIPVDHPGDVISIVPSDKIPPLLEPAVRRAVSDARNAVVRVNLLDDYDNDRLLETIRGRCGGEEESTGVLLHKIAQWVDTLEEWQKNPAVPVDIVAHFLVHIKET